MNRPNTTRALSAADTATVATPARASATKPAKTKDLVTATQAALAAEHAAVYGYGVVGGRVTASQRAQANADYAAHRARRDSLRRAVRDLGATPQAAAAAYALPFPVTDAATAGRLAARLEDKVADVYSDLVRAARGSVRADAAKALSEAAVRAARWRGAGVPFPGLAERA